MKKNINLEIGERVRLTRKSRGFSREELSELLGISTLFLGYIECGQRGMSLSTLQNLCSVLSVSADYILFGRNENLQGLEAIEEAIKSLDEKYYSVAIDAINSLKKIIAVLSAEENKEE